MDSAEYAAWLASKYPSRYCPACGTPTQQIERDGRARPVCPACDHVMYFDPKLAAIALIRRVDAGDERVLLVQRAYDPGRGLWGMPGGFVDLGEHPQRTAEREAFEETGLEVRARRLLDVFHNGQPDGVVTIAYAVDVTGGALQPGDDAADARWFTRDSLPELVFISTITLMKRWQAGEL